VEITFTGVQGEDLLTVDTDQRETNTLDVNAVNLGVDENVL
jgi:hypothetical protein